MGVKDIFKGVYFTSCPQTVPPVETRRLTCYQQLSQGLCLDPGWPDSATCLPQKQANGIKRKRNFIQFDQTGEKLVHCFSIGSTEVVTIYRN